MRKKINPFRIAGRLHNDALDYLGKQLKRRKIANPTIEHILTITCEYLAGRGISDPIQIAANYRRIAQILNTDNAQGLNDLLNQFISEEAKIICLEVLSYDDDKYNLLLKQIPSFETRAWLIENENDCDIVLLFLSIIDSSIKFWKKQQLQSQPYWNRIKGKVIKFPWKADGIGLLKGTFKGMLKAIPTQNINSIWIDGIAEAITASAEARLLKKKNDILSNEDFWASNILFERVAKLKGNKKSQNLLPPNE